MLFKRWLDTREIDALSAEIAADLRRQLPPDLVRAASKAAERARSQLDERVRKRVSTFAAAHRLNVYQKAKLGSRLEGDLEQAGYDAEFAKAFAFEVTTMLALAAAGKT